MGMAASQARYLGLTARKTNVEYMKILLKNYNLIIFLIQSL